MKTDIIPCGPAVNESERRAIAQLKTRLIGHEGDGNWLLLTNLLFSVNERLQSDEIDIVVIGPPGVRVIEVKHWTAAWVNRHPQAVEQEADRVTSKARKMGTALRRKVPHLPRVDGVFLVTEDASKVKTLEAREPIHGVSFHTFNTWRDAVGLELPSILSPEQISALGRTLTPRNVVAMDGQIKNLDGYTHLVLQSPATERFHRVYKATHSARQERVILHLYDMTDSDEANAAKKAEREWEALRRLQQYAWAPRIVDSFQDARGFTGEVKFFTIADPATPTLEERSADHSWNVNGRLSFARQALTALREMHEAGTADQPMIHRNLNGGTVLVKHDNTPILTGFEHTRIPGHVTVTSTSELAAEDRESTTAPEVRSHGKGVANQRSDVFSLCATLSTLFHDEPDDIGISVAAVLDKGLAEASEARSSLSDLEAALSKVSGHGECDTPPPASRYWTEDQVIPFRGQQYRIVSRLGSGGVGTTYKVTGIHRETKDELGTYVAKVVRDEVTGRRVARAHELARSHLRHTALSTIFEVAPEWQDNGFVALLTWVEGMPLSEYTGVLPILADDLGDVSGEGLAIQWLRVACEALGTLHGNGLVHGDVSPRNLIVSGHELVLTDYDCVTKIGAQAEMPGTMLYCAPYGSQGRVSTPSDDLYALAASFFHVLLDREPFQYDGGLAKERGLKWQGSEREEFPMLAAFLDRATDPDPARRFGNTADALAALSEQADRGESSGSSVAQEDGDGVDATARTDRGTPSVALPTQRQENEVPWLKSLLQSYPGSRWGNSETRGLDSEFAVGTYVETRLEQALYRAVQDRQVSLVILCGNAGDGKTALLQYLAREFGLGTQTSASRILTGTLSNTLTVRLNLDGSASWRDRSADEILDEFLEPFQHGRPSEDVAHLLAINDGRLLEWIESVEERGGDTPLTKDLRAFLGGDSVLESPHIRFVNLNLRSLVGSRATDGRSVDDSFLDRLLDSLYGGELAATHWAPCHTCSSQDRCEVFRATRIFGPGELAEGHLRRRARASLFCALQAVHLRGETHITVRELRAALVYVLFGLHYCHDYHAGSNGEDADEKPPPQSYAERAFSPVSTGRQGEVLRDLARFDPGLEAHPRLDRRLLQTLDPEDEERPPHYSGLPLAAARRRAYFEWSETDIQRLTGDPHTLGVARGRHLREFLDLATSDNGDQRRQLTERLCDGISRLETLPREALERETGVPLQITPRTPTETVFWVEKPLDRFRLEVDLPDVGEGVEQLHRQVSLIYVYGNGNEERLRLGAELFHLLLELAEGYQLGDVATDDVFAHLSIFVQRLLQEDDRRMFAWNPMKDTVFEIFVDVDGDAGTTSSQRLVLEPTDS